MRHVTIVYRYNKINLRISMSHILSDIKKTQ
jgi:hypothetical protein